MYVSLFVASLTGHHWTWVVTPVPRSLLHRSPVGGWVVPRLSSAGYRWAWSLLSRLHRPRASVWLLCWPQAGLGSVGVTAYLAPVPLSIFRSNSKFDENSERSSFEYTRPITTIFCTRHDSDTVVTCAKYRCDRPRIFYIRVFWIFIEFRIRSKYA